MLLRELPWSNPHWSKHLFLRCERSVVSDHHLRPDLPQSLLFRRPPPAHHHVSYSMLSRSLRRVTPRRRPYLYPFPPVMRKRNGNPSRTILHLPTRQSFPCTRHLFAMNGNLPPEVLGVPLDAEMTASRVPWSHVQWKSCPTPALSWVLSGIVELPLVSRHHDPVGPSRLYLYLGIIDPCLLPSLHGTYYPLDLFLSRVGFPLQTFF